MSLKSKAGGGFFWASVEKFGQQGLQMAVFIILARLLTPEDFGLLGMVVIFFAIANTFVESGMGQALIRQEKISIADKSTVFWFNFALSTVMYLILFISAPSISRFFNEPQLISLIRLMGLSIIFLGLGIVQRAELTHQLKFKQQAYAQLPAMVIAGIASIGMAFAGYGVWALATQYVLMAFISTLILWFIHPSKIEFLFSKSIFRNLFGFGNKLLLSGLIDTTYQYSYHIIIGKIYSTAVLGFYTQANKIQEITSTSFTGVIQKVSYPLLSKAEKDIVRLKRAYRQVIQLSSFIIFPGMLLLIFLAEPLIILFLGPQWAPSVIFVQLLSLSYIIYHIHAINLNILKVLNRSDLFLRLEIIKKGMITIAIVVGIQFGIYGLIVGQIISSYLGLIINTYYTAKFLNYSFKEQAKDVLNIFMLNIPLIVSLGFVNWLFDINSLLTLFVVIIVSIFIYIASNIIYKTETGILAFDIAEPIIPSIFKKPFLI